MGSNPDPPPPFAVDFEACGIEYQVGDRPLGAANIHHQGLGPLADTAVVRASEVQPHPLEQGIDEAFRLTQAEVEDGLNHQSGGDSQVAVEVGLASFVALRSVVPVPDGVLIYPESRSATVDQEGIVFRPVIDKPFRVLRT